MAPRELSHYSKFGKEDEDEDEDEDEEEENEYFARGVTRKSLWWQVCVLYHQAYVEQALRLVYGHIGAPTTSHGSSRPRTCWTATLLRN